MASAFNIAVFLFKLRHLGLCTARDCILSGKGDGDAIFQDEICQLCCPERQYSRGTGKLPDLPRALRGHSSILQSPQELRRRKDCMASAQNLCAANDVVRARKLEHIHLWDQSEEQEFQEQSKLCHWQEVAASDRQGCH